MACGGYVGLSTGRTHLQRDRCLRTLGPLDGKRNDTLVVEVIHGESCVPKQKVFGIRRASLRTFRGYACGQQLRASWVFVAHTQGDTTLASLSNHRHGIKLQIKNMWDTSEISQVGLKACSCHTRVTLMSLQK